jgi:hypothetical protein
VILVTNSIENVTGYGLGDVASDVIVEEELVGVVFSVSCTSSITRVVKPRHVDDKTSGSRIMVND